MLVFVPLACLGVCFINTACLQLTLLDLCLAAQVTDVGAKVICIAIKMNLALKTLGLSRNALPDDSKRALHDAWSQREAESGLAQSGM